MIPEMTKEQVMEMGKMFGDSFILGTPPEKIVEKFGGFEAFFDQLPKKSLPAPMLRDLMDELDPEARKALIEDMIKRYGY
ncbi:MAG: hypothetical protein QNK37_21715 [Acidobacteriota bacterium]|nr:hypothetical protein [Acidobacteriota bacterium]